MCSRKLRNRSAVRRKVPQFFSSMPMMAAVVCEHSASLCFYGI
uniref:Uncharacterized protein n=1 Tax=Faecalibaculum rodentium TaxID=1702221 RepID=A0A140DU81_9FIRM|nr:hypothetical protein AALO17_10740 [Faecalibaculum rodentium]